MVIFYSKLQINAFILIGPAVIFIFRSSFADNPYTFRRYLFVGC